MANTIKRVSGMFLRDCIKKANRLHEGKYTEPKHRECVRLQQIADGYLDDFAAQKLKLNTNLHEDFAQYIDTFGQSRREELLDILQKQAAFDVRAFLDDTPQTWWQKWQRRRQMPYLNARRLYHKVRKIDELEKHLAAAGMHSRIYHLKAEELYHEAAQYIKAFAEDKYMVKPADLGAFQAYVRAAGSFYDNSPAERALAKITAQTEQNFTAAPAPKRSLWSRFKKAAVGTILGIGSLFGLNSDTQAAPLAKINSENAAKPANLARKYNLFHRRRIWDNFYRYRLGKMMSESEIREQATQLQQQLENGTSLLPPDISVLQYLYTQQMHKKNTRLRRSPAKQKDVKQSTEPNLRN